MRKIPKIIGLFLVMQACGMGDQRGSALAASGDDVRVADLGQDVALLIGAPCGSKKAALDKKALYWFNPSTQQYYPVIERNGKLYKEMHETNQWIEVTELDRLFYYRDGDYVPVESGTAVMTPTGKKLSNCLDVTPDIAMMRATLRDPWEYKIEEQIYHEGVPEKVTDVLERTRSLAVEAGQEGTFVWYFAGHSRLSTGGLVFYDEDLFFEQIFAAIKEAREQAGLPKLKRFVLLLDTCIAGRVYESLKGRGETEFARKVLVGAASQSGGYAYHYTRGNAAMGGVFTRAYYEANQRMRNACMIVQPQGKPTWKQQFDLTIQLTSQIARSIRVDQVASYTARPWDGPLHDFMLPYACGGDPDIYPIPQLSIFSKVQTGPFSFAINGAIAGLRTFDSYIVDNNEITGSGPLGSRAEGWSFSYPVKRFNSNVQTLHLTIGPISESTQTESYPVAFYQF